MKKLGTVKASNNQSISANYTAPEKLTTDNITITLELNDVYINEITTRGRRKMITRQRHVSKLASFSCKVKLYDAYTISVVQKLHDIAEILGNSELKDSANFTVFIYADEAQIIEDDIKNFPPEVIKEGSFGQGIGTMKEKIHTNGAQGSIHITKNISNYRLSETYPPEVYFELESQEILLCHVQYVQVKMNVASPISAIPYRSVISEINFIANGREQRYKVSVATLNSYSLTVTPMRE